MSQHSSQIKLRFHETHGSNIMVYNNWTKARRTQTNDDGLVFTSDPIQIFQKIVIKLTEVSDRLPGIVSVGFTSHDPSNLRFGLPKCTRTELKRKAGFWICSLSKKLCAKNAILSFYVDASGNIHYCIEGKDKGHFQKNVNIDNKLWGLIDIWSPPTEILLIEPRAIANSTPFLHNFRSGNVKICENNVHKSDRKNHTSYVFTYKPLELNKHIKIKFLNEGNLALGVTSCDPASLEDHHLPESPDLFLDRSEYWIVINDPTWHFETNEEINYVITTEGEMKIWKNNYSLLLKKIHVDQTLRLWGFFALGTVRDIEITNSESFGAEGPPVVPPLVPRKTKELTSLPQSSYGDKTRENESICVVCCDNNAEAALYPCGHMCMCFHCAKKQWRGGGDGNCPICRMKIKDVLKVYKS